MRSAIALFCDDVRLEATGKRIIVGLYQNKLLTPVLPFTIPNLTIMVFVRTSLEDPFRKCAIRIKLPGQDETVIDPSMPTDDVLKAQFSDPEFKAYTIEGMLSTGPLEIRDPVTIRVVVQTEREEFQAGSLRIEALPQQRERAVQNT
jgi:hypothetical protein